MSEIIKRCRTCKFCREMRGGPMRWSFLGCFCESHKGKWIAEIEICPLEGEAQKDGEGEEANE